MKRTITYLSILTALTFAGFVFTNESIADPPNPIEPLPNCETLEACSPVGAERQCSWILGESMGKCTQQCGSDGFWDIPNTQTECTWPNVH